MISTNLQNKNFSQFVVCMQMFRERKHDMKSAKQKQQILNPSVEIQKERFYPEMFDNQVSATVIHTRRDKESFLSGEQAARENK